MSFNNQTAARARTPNSYRPPGTNSISPAPGLPDQSYRELGNRVRESRGAQESFQRNTPRPNRGYSPPPPAPPATYGRGGIAPGNYYDRASPVPRPPDPTGLKPGPYGTGTRPNLPRLPINPRPSRANPSPRSVPRGMGGRAISGGAVVSGAVAAGVTLASGGSVAESVGAGVGAGVGTVAGSRVGAALGQMVGGRNGALAGAGVGGQIGGFVGQELGRRLGDYLDGDEPKQQLPTEEITPTIPYDPNEYGQTGFTGGQCNAVLYNVQWSYTRTRKSNPTDVETASGNVNRYGPVLGSRFSSDAFQINSQGSQSAGLRPQGWFTVGSINKDLFNYQGGITGISPISSTFIDNCGNPPPAPAPPERPLVLANGAPAVSPLNLPGRIPTTPLTAPNFTPSPTSNPDRPPTQPYPPAPSPTPTPRPTLPTQTPDPEPEPEPERAPDATPNNVPSRTPSPATRTRTSPGRSLGDSSAVTGSSGAPAGSRTFEETLRDTFPSFEERLREIFPSFEDRLRQTFPGFEERLREIFPDPQPDPTAPTEIPEREGNPDPDREEIPQKTPTPIALPIPIPIPLPLPVPTATQGATRIDNPNTNQVTPPTPTRPPDPTPTGGPCGCNTPLLAGQQTIIQQLERISGQPASNTPAPQPPATEGVTLAAIMAKLNSMQDFAARAWEMTRLQKVLDVLTFLGVMHTVFMLSRDVGETFLYALSNASSAIGIKDEEGNAFDLQSVLGKTVNNLLVSLFGEDVVNGTREAFQKANRIVQSASAVIWTVRSLTDTTHDLMEWVAENTGKIGNALKRFGVVGERAYPWMSERAQARNKLRARFDKVTETLENAEDRISVFDQATMNVIEIQEETGELADNFRNFKSSVTDAIPDPWADNTPVNDAVTTEKTVSESPDVTATDADR